MLEGIYRCCTSGTFEKRGQVSSVERAEGVRLYRTAVSCGSGGGLLGVGGACGRTESLAGSQVTVETAFVPSLLGGLSPTVTRLAGPGGDVRIRPDQEIIAEWWSNSRWDVAFASSQVGIYTYLLVFLVRMYLSGKRKSITNTLRRDGNASAQ